MLIDYFESHCSDLNRVCLELPHHLLEAGEKRKLIEFIRSKKSIHMPQHQKQSYLRVRTNETYRYLYISTLIASHSSSYLDTLLNYYRIIHCYFDPYLEINRIINLISLQN